MENQIEPIPLTLSNEMEDYLALIEWSKKQLQEYFKTMLITDDQNGNPAPRPQQVLDYMEKNKPF